MIKTKAPGDFERDYGDHHIRDEIEAEKNLVCLRSSGNCDLNAGHPTPESLLFHAKRGHLVDC